MAPLVTIAIPTYDRLEYLKEAVASALCQTYGNIEVLISDDGPAESIRQWSEAVAANEPRIRYRRNARTLGLAGNWNALTDAARGEFIVIIGDDDRLLPAFVSKLITAIQPNCQVAFANHYLIDEHGHRLEAESARHTRFYRRDRLPAGKLSTPSAVVWQNSVPISAALIRTSDVRRLRFKEDLNTPEIEFFIRLAQEGGSFVFSPEYLSEYRVHGKSETSAGLRSEKLARYLLPMSVPHEVECYKREFMSPLLTNAVGRCLRQGDYGSARAFIRSEYYPRLRWNGSIMSNGPTAQAGDSEVGRSQRVSTRFLIIAAQRVCAALPPWLGCPAYRLLYRMKH
jgi:glycosyltransferase involved in cell wall biosynthesis